MSARAVVLSVVALLVAGAVGAGATLLVRGAGPGTAAVPDPASAARTAFPGLAAAGGEPELPGFAAVHPEPGSVEVVEGPFDDRLDLGDLRLGDGAVTGTVAITSDVSELIELQVVAGFYDADGRLLGTGRFTHHAGDQEHSHTGPPAEEESFTVVVPEDLGAAVASAAVGVPVLVNE
ncbi:hypothetical protein ACIG47_08970 [Promicromonospora sp. NPDC052451]|uniref:hypothetical protein n=1 Tax=Promicromonospora sp. NPDC052451 TaxID=3364407 RepID=UPI0037C66694